MVVKLPFRPKRPPRLVFRTLVATSAAIALVLIAVFVVLSMDASRRAQAAAVDTLDASERIFAELERHRQEESLLKLTALAEHPGLAAAITSFRANDAASRAPFQRELDRLASQLAVDALVAAAPNGLVVASAGARRAAWLPDSYVVGPGASESVELPEIDALVRRPSALFLVSGLSVAARNPALGYIYIADAVDDGYAAKLGTLLRMPVAVMVDGEVVASTLPGTVRSAMLRSGATLPKQGVVHLADEPYAIRQLNSGWPLSVYAVESVGAHRATRNAAEILAVVGIGAMLLGVLAAFWIARALSDPIDQLSQQMRQMAEARDFSKKIPRTGSSRELDAFTDTFNHLVTSLQAAEAQTELAYVGAIKALAAALDARDPYTAGHSERVSALSIMIGRQLNLDQEQLEILRLGALLHDIGKIGVADRVLQKNGPLTQEEFEIIKTHPTLGAHILRQISFLTPHIPIVELHHERPDGRGYPHGLIGHATPLLARIVHVADAFDAMTTARAYRPAQTPTHAISELWRYAGSQFDAEVVEAFVAAWSAVPVVEDRPDITAVLARANVLPFERQATR